VNSCMVTCPRSPRLGCPRSQCPFLLRRCCPLPLLRCCPLPLLRCCCLAEAHRAGKTASPLNTRTPARPHSVQAAGGLVTAPMQHIFMCWCSAQPARPGAQTGQGRARHQRGVFTRYASAEKQRRSSCCCCCCCCCCRPAVAHPDCRAQRARAPPRAALQRATRPSHSRCNPGDLAASSSWVPCLRVRGQIMGSPQSRNVGESQPVLIMIDPVLSLRARRSAVCERAGERVALFMRVARARTHPPRYDSSYRVPGPAQFRRPGCTSARS
jgi:hypothetical protein